MKITVITGSPHKKGTSALLADEFIRGAREQGHEVFRFDAAQEELHPCLGCDRCGSTGACVYQDGIARLMPHLKESDGVVFVTPLYYFGMSAQLKTVVDRFYSVNYELMGSRKKAALLATAYDNKSWTFQALEAHYKTVVQYLEWEDGGMILAGGCGVRRDAEASVYPQKVYEMGRRFL